MYGMVDEIQDLRRQVRFYQIVSAILAVLLFTACFIALARSADAAPKPDPIERCAGPALPYVSCVTAGYAWVIVGTSGPDKLIGYLGNDIIHSGKGADIVDGKGGRDVCYVQPVDVVRNCEEEK